MAETLDSATSLDRTNFLKNPSRINNLLGFLAFRACLHYKGGTQMTVAMVSLNRDSKSRAWVARKALPADVRDEYFRLYGVRREALFRAPAQSTQSQAKRLFTDWLAEVESRITAIRGSLKGHGRDLSEREALALAGEWYVWFVGQHEKSPGSTTRWDELLEELRDTALRQLPLHVGDATGMGELEALLDEPHVRSAVRAFLSDEAKTAQFFGSRGMVLSNEASALFLDKLEPEFVAAVRLLRRRAEGDFRPDKRPERFLKLPDGRPAGMGFWKLFETWVLERRPAASTVERWRAPAQSLEEHFAGRDVTTITADDAADWANGLVTEDRSGTTVNDIYLAMAKRLFGWAKQKRIVQTNPFDGLRVAAPREELNREGRWFTSEEIEAILKTTLVPPSGRLSAKKAAAFRWIPWLCAYTGARSGEMTQLRGVDVRQVNGVWTIAIKPEAGTVKGGKARTVPLHEHLVAQGFPEFAASSGPGPLFCDPEAVTKEEPSRSVGKPRRPPAVIVRQKVAEWVRTVAKVTDPEIRPNHAWRHTFKRQALRNGIPVHVADAICGHAPDRVAEIYMTPTVEDMAAELRKFPRWPVAA